MNRRSTGADLVLAALSAGVLLTLACGGGKKVEEKLGEEAMEGVIEQATGHRADVDLSRNGKEVKINSEDGSVEMAETSEWPSDMFPEVPRFEGGRVAHVTKGDASGFARFNVLFKEVEDGALSGYAAALKAAGWEAQVVNMGPKGGLISGQKGDLGLNFTVSGEQNEAVLAVFRTGGGTDRSAPSDARAERRWNAAGAAGAASTAEFTWTASSRGSLASQPREPTPRRVREQRLRRQSLHRVLIP